MNFNLKVNMTFEGHVENLIGHDLTGKGHAAFQSMRIVVPNTYKYGVFKLIALACLSKVIAEKLATFHDLKTEVTLGSW